jgi:triacylglycerol esterase/lipase EstA (alpha/beta hydrolase family)
MRRGASRILVLGTVTLVCALLAMAGPASAGATGTASAGAGATGTTSAAQATTGGGLIGLLYQPLGISPPGSNDFACKPGAAHPYPVVLVHGTLLDQTEDWVLMSLVLKRAGYCVFSLDYGNRATGPIEASADQLAAFIMRVLGATGAQRVAIVGHSQGGMMPRYYLKFLGGTAHVSELVGLAPSNHGTTLPLAGPVGQYGDCPACSEQVVGSPFLRKLNAGDQAPGPVSYTVIETSHDEIVTPYQSAFLPREGGRVTNALLQARCPADLSEHVSITYDPVAIQWVLNALGRPGPADPRFRPDCLGLAPLLRGS